MNLINTNDERACELLEQLPTAPTIAGKKATNLRKTCLNIDCPERNGGKCTAGEVKQPTNTKGENGSE